MTEIIFKKLLLKTTSLPKKSKCYSQQTIPSSLPKEKPPGTVKSLLSEGKMISIMKTWGNKYRWGQYLALKCIRRSSWGIKLNLLFAQFTVLGRGSDRETWEEHFCLQKVMICVALKHWEASAVHAVLIKFHSFLLKYQCNNLELG